MHISVSDWAKRKRLGDLERDKNILWTDETNAESE